MMKIIKALLLSAVLGLSAAVLAAVDINLANQEELQQLKGIGAKKAADIIAYREANGRFESVDDLTKVKGIGKATLKKLRSEITVGESEGNTASEAVAGKTTVKKTKADKVVVEKKEDTGNAAATEAKVETKSGKTEEGKKTDESDKNN